MNTTRTGRKTPTRRSGLPVRFAILLAVCVLIGAAGTLAGLPVYVTAQGQSQGVIEGDVMLPGREGTIEVFEIHHLIHRPESQLVHEPLILTKPVDGASTNLLRAMDQSEPLTLLLDFYRVGGGGQDEVYYQILLEDARVVAIEPVTPNLAVTTNANLPHMERVRIQYVAITVAHPGDGDVLTLFNFD